MSQLMHFQFHVDLSFCGKSKILSANLWAAAVPMTNVGVADPHWLYSPW